MEAVRPLQTTVAPRAPAFFPNFAMNILPAFAGMERLTAEETAGGLLISGIWDPDLEVAASLIRDNFGGEVVWTKPTIRYIWEPRILEPILRVEVRAPSDSLGNVIGDLCSRRGMLLRQTETPEGFVISADVPLAELLGYHRSLHALTGGKGEAAATFIRYELAPGHGPDPDEPMSAALRA
jgi:predicted membrane GTPase involved in stress response